jgi:acyl-CoA hydrolase
MTEMVLQTHINAVDSIFGGVIMSWIDIAAAISASRHSGRSVVTASVDDLDFVAPVYKGWIVNLRACVNFTGRTSMEVGVRVDAENPIEDKMFHTASAYLTFVAVDSNGKPVEVPPVIPGTDDEKRRYHDGQIRRQLRLERRAQFARNKNHPV